MNLDAVLLVRTARSLVEKWRANAYEGDMDSVNEHVELLAVSLHKLGLTTEEISAQYAPDRNVVGVGDLISTIRDVGTAIVASLEGIRLELRLERGNPPPGNLARQRALDSVISELLPRLQCNDAKTA